MITTTPNLDFWQWFQALNPDHRLELIGVVAGVIIAIAVIICFLVNTIHRRRAELEMKRELLDRGMSADEIATVISSSRGKGCPTRTS